MTSIRLSLEDSAASIGQAIRRSMRPSYVLWAVSAIVVIGFLGVPVGGFVFGLEVSNPPHSILVGIVFSILTVLFLGFPPKDESGSGDRYDVWPYIFGSEMVLFAAFALLFLIVWLRSIRRRRW